MRYLLALLSLAACASDPGQSQPITNADPSLCPLTAQYGATSAIWFPDGRCEYVCPSISRHCPTATDRVGPCVEYNDRSNCGACGEVCGSAYSCVQRDPRYGYACWPR